MINFTSQQSVGWECEYSESKDDVDPVKTGSGIKKNCFEYTDYIERWTMKGGQSFPLYCKLISTCINQVSFR